jgi:hypothetical protein
MRVLESLTTTGLSLMLVAGLAATGLGLAGTLSPAAAKELKLVCPTDGSDDYAYKDQRTKETKPIRDPQQKAIAERACQGPKLDSTGLGPVAIVNQQSVAIYVGFTASGGTPGAIAWGSGCTASGSGVKIAAGATCNANVTADGTSTRFCADTSAVPSNCFEAQQNNQTMIETNFEPASNGGCFNQGNCVWFDISLIPSTCTDALWDQNQCADTGGASYNLPVSVACGASTVYTCQGPVSGTWGPENYPSNCGNPDSICQSTPNCQNAYFYPMFEPPENAYQPNTVCTAAQTLTITFLAGD